MSFYLSKRPEGAPTVPTPDPVRPIPMSYNDPLFANNTLAAVSVLAIGQSLTEKSFTVSNANGDPVIGCAGANTLTRCRFGSPYVREGIRIAGDGVFLIDQCFINVDGLLGSGDHADGIQAFSPTSKGTIFLNNTFIHAYSNGTGPGGEGAVGVFIADNWTGTFKCHNVVFQGGEFGCRAFPDFDGDMHIDFNGVYFVGPFAQTQFSIGQAFGGHETVIDQWIDVYNATIVGNQIIVGSAIPAPVPDPAFPNATNTGPVVGTTFTPVSGDVNSNAPGQIIENLNVTGQIIIRHANVIVRNCIINCTEFYGISTVGANLTGCIIFRTRIIGVGNTAGIGLDGCPGVEIDRCDLSNLQNGIFISSNNMNIHDNWIHDLGSGAADPHFDGIQGSGGFTACTINHNTIESFDTSCIIAQNEGAAFSGLVITNNKLILSDGAACVLCQDLDSGVGTVDNITVTGNRMQKGVNPGSSYGFFHNVTNLTWSGNTDYNTGATINPDIG